MRYLYIDTSSSYLYTAIVENNKLISEIEKHPSYTVPVSRYSS